MLGIRMTASSIGLGATAIIPQKQRKRKAQRETRVPAQQSHLLSSDWHDQMAPANTVWMPDSALDCVSHAVFGLEVATAAWGRAASFIALVSAPARSIAYLTAISGYARIIPTFY